VSDPKSRQSSGANLEGREGREEKLEGKWRGRKRKRGLWSLGHAEIPQASVLFFYPLCQALPALGQDSQGPTQPHLLCQDCILATVCDCPLVSRSGSAVSLIPALPTSIRNKSVSHQALGWRPTEKEHGLILRMHSIEKRRTRNQTMTTQ
jgi:hypothetical protein